MSDNLGACMDSLRPMCDSLNRLLATAPLDPDGRAALAVAIATYFFASACAALRMANQGGAAELSELLLATSVDRPNSGSVIH